MLQTGLNHIESQADFESLVRDNEKVMLCCGRMGPMCLPVYDIMESLGEDYANVAFRDMDFDGPASSIVRRLPHVRDFFSLPFTIYYNNGEVVHATSGIQTHQQVTESLDRAFGTAS